MVCLSGRAAAGRAGLWHGGARAAARVLRQCSLFVHDVSPQDTRARARSAWGAEQGDPAPRLTLP